MSRGKFAVFCNITCLQRNNVFYFLFRTTEMTTSEADPTVKTPQANSNNSDVVSEGTINSKTPFFVTTQEHEPGQTTWTPKLVSEQLSDQPGRTIKFTDKQTVAKTDAKTDKQTDRQTDQYSTVRVVEVTTQSNMVDDGTHPQSNMLDSNVVDGGCSGEACNDAITMCRMFVCYLYISSCTSTCIYYCVYISTFALQNHLNHVTLQSALAPPSPLRTNRNRTFRPLPEPTGTGIPVGSSSPPLPSGAVL